MRYLFIVSLLFIGTSVMANNDISGLDLSKVQYATEIAFDNYKASLSGLQPNIAAAEIDFENEEHGIVLNAFLPVQNKAIILKDDDKLFKLITSYYMTVPSSIDGSPADIFLCHSSVDVVTSSALVIAVKKSKTTCNWKGKKEEESLYNNP